MLLRLHFIFFLVITFLPELKCSKFEEVSKLEFIFSQIFEPYQFALDNFGENIDNTLWNPLQLYFGEHFKESCDDFTYAETSKIHHYKAKQSFNYQRKNEKTDEHQNRILQPFHDECMHGGYLVDSSVTIYICDGIRVAKSYYDESNKDKNCSISTFTKKYCYCPFDYYGEFCEYINAPICIIEPTSHPTSQCNEQVSKDYVYSYGQNDMPCFSSKRDNVLKLTFKASCKHEDLRWTHEGIKIESEEIVKTEPQERTFSYKINTPDLKVSHYTSIPLQLRFANWKKIFNPLIIEEKLTEDQISGSKEIIFLLKLDSKFQDFRFAGRYHYEINVNEPFKILNKVMGVIEDADFEEPRIIKRSPISRYLFYLLLGLVISIITLILFKYKNIIFIGKSKRKKSYTQLVELHEFDNSTS